MAKSVPAPSSLSDDARSRVGPKGPRNDVTRLWSKLDRDDPALAAEFAAAVNDRDVPAAGLARALKARGHHLAEQSISRFRALGRTL